MHHLSLSLPWRFESVARSRMLVGALEPGDVDLLHLHHRPHDGLRFRGVVIPKQTPQGSGDDLPRYAELVLEPAAALLLAAGGELLPQRVDFALSLAVDEERYCRREGEMRAAVEREELLPFELEDHGHRRPFRAGVHLGDLRILEDGRVELRRLFGPAVEPQEGSYLRHCLFLYFPRSMG